MGWTRFSWILPCVGVLALVSFCLAADGGTTKLILQDDFTGADGDPPDWSKWRSLNRDVNDVLEIRDNALRSYVYDGGAARLATRDNFTADHLTLLVDYYGINLVQRPFDLWVNTLYTDGFKEMITIEYDKGTGWGYYCLRDGNLVHFTSNNAHILVQTWYSLNLTVDVDSFNVSVRERGTGASVWSVADVRIDALRSCSYLFMGSYAPLYGGYPDACWDNFRLYDLDWNALTSPVWGPLPILRATEDIPLIYDFSGNVSDPDTPPSGLIVSSGSPYVISVSGLTVTFLFPNGVTDAIISLRLSDGHAYADASIEVIVTPVNDPPVCTVPRDHTATEDIPLELDLAPYLSDIDNPMSDLSLATDSPFAKVDGLVLTLLFPEGILAHEMTVRVSDGIDFTESDLRFVVIPVDDPPRIAPLGTFNATEDLESVLDLEPYLSDVDTPVPQLKVTVELAECTARGHRLAFLFSHGGPDTDVWILVSDAHSTVGAVLLVHVVEVDDPPRISTVPLQQFQVGQARTVDLGPYVTDEDTPASDLVLGCVDGALVSIHGLNVTFLYTGLVPDHRIAFTISDKASTVGDGLNVTVYLINQPPRILSIGDQVPPVVLVVEEGSVDWFEVRVQDNDSSALSFSLESERGGLEVSQNGTLRISSRLGDIGEFAAAVTVTDPAGASDRMPFRVRVVGRDRPPDAPDIRAPANHSLFHRGERISLVVYVSDPDLPVDGRLTVSWTSNLTGASDVQTGIGELRFWVSNLTSGTHRITVTVSDGQLERAGWIEVTITDAAPTPTPGPSFRIPWSVWAWVVIVLVVALIVTALLVRRSNESR